jgi:prepilin-type N-terminal cleavage/methylation domain-containing protein
MIARWHTRRLLRPSKRQPTSASPRTDQGFTLVETITVLFISTVLIAVMTPFLMATTTSLNTSSKLIQAQAQARLAIESMQLQVESASEVCLPTQFTASGFSLRILQIVSTSQTGGSLTDNYRWVQWQLLTTTKVLQEERSTVQSSSGDSSITWTGGWMPIATGIANTSTGSSPTPPFTLVTPASGSPQGLAVNLIINGATSGTPGSMQLTTDYAAFATPYSDAGATACSGALPDE